VCAYTYKDNLHIQHRLSSLPSPFVIYPLARPFAWPPQVWRWASDFYKLDETLREKLPLKSMPTLPRMNPNLTPHQRAKVSNKYLRRVIAMCQQESCAIVTAFVRPDNLEEGPMDLWLPRELRAMMTEMSLTKRQTTYLAIRSELQLLLGRELQKQEKGIVYHHLANSNVLNQEAHSARAEEGALRMSLAKSARDFRKGAPLPAQKPSKREGGREGVLRSYLDYIYVHLCIWHMYVCLSMYV
jgi:hypothetical protein